MKLLTKKIQQKMPALYEKDGEGYDAIVHIKFFDPTGSWTWYATEANALIQSKEWDGVKEVPLSQFKKSIDNLNVPYETEEYGWVIVCDVTFFGLVIGFEQELGYFSLKELKTVIGRLGLGIERDLYFNSKPLRKCEYVNISG